MPGTARSIRLTLSRTELRTWSEDGVYNELQGIVRCCCAGGNETEPPYRDTGRSGGTNPGRTKEPDGRPPSADALRADLLLFGLRGHIQTVSSPDAISGLRRRSLGGYKAS